jgi:hypothetical protein
MGARVRGRREKGEAVNEPETPKDSVESKEHTARRVLHAYRERRRKRRGEDTYFGSSALFRAAVEDGITVSELDSRRSSILDEATEEGMSPELVGILYDVALEEGLDPAVAFELVRTGLGVAPPADGVSTGSEAPVSDKYLPTWMFPATPPDQLLRERMLRFSFRRLRAFLEEEEDVDEAFRRFANEPDVGHHGY